VLLAALLQVHCPPRSMQQGSPGPSPSRPLCALSAYRRAPHGLRVTPAALDKPKRRSPRAAEGGMTTDPKLLALAAQLAAAAGFAASAPGAPLVAAQAAGNAGPAPTGRAGPAGAQALVPALWNLDRLDQAAPPLDGLFRRDCPRRAPSVGREAGGGALLGVPHPTGVRAGRRSVQATEQCEG